MKQNEKIINLMKGDSPYTNKTLSELSELIVKYPYFSIVHVLHTMNLMHLEDAHFLFDIRKTAIYAPDRMQLFFRIKDDFTISELIEAIGAEVLSNNPPLELADTFAFDNFDDTGSEKIESDFPPVSINSDSESYLDSNLPYEEEEVEEVEEEEDSDLPEEEEMEEEQEEEALHFKHQELIDKFLEENPDLPEEEKDEEEQEEEAPLFKHQELIDKFLEENPDLPEEEEMEEEQQEEAPHFKHQELIDKFLEENPDLPEEEEKEEEQKEEAPHFKHQELIDKFLEENPDLPEEEKDEEQQEETPLLKHQKIIDEFIEKDSISPVKITLAKPDEAPVQDEPEKEFQDQLLEPAKDEDFFSVTLAKIYIKQKKYTKALEIIRKLNLQYPEKNRYFADQIRFLEKLIINTNK